MVRLKALVERRMKECGFQSDIIIESLDGAEDYLFSSKTTVEQKDEPKRDGMEEVTIYRFQLDAILEALRVAANSYDLRKQETCLGRMVTQAERFAKNALKGEKDKYVRYGQQFPQSQESME